MKINFRYVVPGYISFIVLSIATVFSISVAGFSTFIQETSTTKFCISCHEMESTVYEEYKKTIHYKNASGVRAGCSDCHVPHDWLMTISRKLFAVKDVYHHFAGTIDTLEKFEERRLLLAQRVWTSMEKSDSIECRNCHTFSAMTLDKQRLRARKQHENAMNNGETCIDCHKGIAHKPVHEQLEKFDDEEIFLEF